MGLLDWFKRKSADDSLGQSPEETLADLREYARMIINPGFYSLNEVLEVVHDSNKDSETPLDVTVVEQLTRDLWKARHEELRRAEAAAVGRPDDYSRLCLAFETLEAQGVVTRMNFSCCQNCGQGEIQDERLPGGSETGYVFFHQQDAERLAEGSPRLYFAYGPNRQSLPVAPDRFKLAEAGDEAARSEIDEFWEIEELSVGRALSEALTAQGFIVDWDGTTSQRPSITITDWRKPLPG